MSAPVEAVRTVAAGVPVPGVSPEKVEKGLIKGLQAFLGVHPTTKKSQIGIEEESLAKHDDGDSPVDFWQLTCPQTVDLRLVALRLLAAKPTSLGVERLWSAARLTLTDNRRSMRSERLMQLLCVKMNMHMLGDGGLLEALGIDPNSSQCTFKSIWDDLQSTEETEQHCRAELGVGEECVAEPVDGDSDGPASPKMVNLYSSDDE